MVVCIQSWQSGVEHGEGCAGKAWAVARAAGRVAGVAPSDGRAHQGGVSAAARSKLLPAAPDGPRAQRRRYVHGNRTRRHARTKSPEHPERLQRRNSM